MRFITPVIAVTLCSAFSAAWGAEPLDADPVAFRFNPIVSAGVTYGGDTIGTYRYWSFGNEIDVDLNAGGTLFTFGGVSMLWPRQHVGLLLQGGRLIGSVSNQNFEEQLANFTRWPIELIGFVEWKRFRGGVGVTHHFSPKSEEKGIVDITRRFEDATGTVLQVDYLFERFSVGLRHVAIDYEYEIESSKLNGDHWGLVIAYRFGKTR